MREIDWAKAALARNPAYEIVATDESTGVFTVRDTATGRCRRCGSKIWSPRRCRQGRPRNAGAARRPHPPERRSNPQPRPTHPSARWPRSNYRAASRPRAGAGEPLAEGPGYSITRGAGTPRPAGSARRPRLHHHAPRARQRAERARAPNRSPPTSNAAPIPSSARAIASCASMARPSSSPATPSSPRKAATSTSATRASAPAASASSRARRACTSSTAPSAARAVRTKPREGAEIYVARSTFTGVGRRFDSATMNDLGGNAYETN